MRKKKKYLLFAFCLLLGFSVLGIQASAKDSKPEIRYIKVTKKNARPGEKVKFRIKLANDKKAKSVGLFLRTPVTADQKELTLKYHKASREWKLEN